MCEKRIRKLLKKGSQVTRLREARRLQHIERMPPAANDGSPPQYAMVGVDKAVQNKLILELAWKTVTLMQKNRLIQEKIVALQKETSDFVSAIVNNPVNRQRYIDYMLAHPNLAVPNLTTDNKENLPYKTGPAT